MGVVADVVASATAVFCLSGLAEPSSSSLSALDAAALDEAESEEAGDEEQEPAEAVVLRTSSCLMDWIFR